MALLFSTITDKKVLVESMFSGFFALLKVQLIVLHVLFVFKLIFY